MLSPLFTPHIGKDPTIVGEEYYSNILTWDDTSNKLKETGLINYQDFGSQDSLQWAWWWLHLCPQN